MDQICPEGGHMRQYELTVIFPVEEDQYKTGKEQLIAALAAHGAQIEKSDELGDRNLAYPIKKQTRGHYIIFTVKADPAQLENLDKVLKLNPRILRFLFVKIEE